MLYEKLLSLTAFGGPVCDATRPLLTTKTNTFLPASAGEIFTTRLHSHTTGIHTLDQQKGVKI